MPADSRRVLVLGSRPCDAAALDILDSILIGEVRDTRYAARRQETVIMTLACSSCDEACFCTSMGYGPHDATGSDILGLPLEGGYAIRALTDKGKLVIARASPDHYEELSTAQILTGKCWTVPVLANGRIYARNADGRLVCVDVRNRG